MSSLHKVRAFLRRVNIPRGGASGVTGAWNDRRNGTWIAQTSGGRAAILLWRGRRGTRHGLTHSSHFHCRTAKQGGLPRLYRGVLPACLRPQALCMYTGNEWCKVRTAG